MSNDVHRTRLKVSLSEVPSTNSYRAQQLSSLSEAVKALPPNYQAAMLPFMVSLMDIPFKEKAIEAIKAVEQQQTPEQIQEQIQQAVQDALAKAGNENKGRELDIREREAAAREKLLQAQTVNTGITSTFAAMQAAEKIAINPAIAPVGDVVMQQAGWTPPTPGGQDPNIPAPVQQMPVEQPGGLPGDTTPTTPDVPTSADMGANEGIETLRSD